MRSLAHALTHECVPLPHSGNGKERQFHCGSEEHPRQSTHYGGGTHEKQLQVLESEGTTGTETKDGLGQEYDKFCADVESL